MLSLSGYLWGLEDHGWGIWVFTITGTRDGITALQMDFKPWRS